MTESRLAVVTGTSRGLGLAIANRLIADGFRVVGVSRSRPSDSDLQDQAGLYAHVDFDASDVDGISDLARDIQKAHGAHFALVNNAAVGTDGILPTMHNSDIAAVLALNLTSPIVFCKYFSRPM